MDLFAIRVQWLEWILALGGLFLLFRPRILNQWMEQGRANSLSSSRVLIGFFIFATACKWAQYFCLRLNAQDFWLFVDLFETARVGKFGVSHFAPQAWGPVQHGVIHPFVLWLLLTPLSYFFGSVAVALVFQPACLAFAGYLLDRIGVQLGLLPRFRVFLLVAFLLSRQVSLTLMYEVHPEALYPALTFGFILLLMRERFWLAASVGGVLALLKEDSFMVLWGSLVTLVALDSNLFKRRWKVICLVFSLTLLTYLIQIRLIHDFKYWAHGAWVPESGPIGGRQKWDSLSGILQTAEALLAANGGFGGAIKNFFSFVISDSWRGVLFAAPWVAFSPGFWISELPLALSFSLRGANAVFWNYYSIPFVAFFWIFVLQSLMGKISARWPLTVLVLSLLNGSEGMVLNIPSVKILRFRDEAAEFQRLIEAEKGEGVVLARLLPFVSLNRVVSDRLPDSSENEARVSFYFLTKDLTSWNIPIDVLNAKIAELRRSGSGFVVAKETPEIILFLRAR